MLRGQSAAQQPMLAQSLKGVAFTTVGAQYLCMHVVVVGTPGRSTTLNMGQCQVKTGGLVNDTTPASTGQLCQKHFATSLEYIIKKINIF